LKENEEYFLKRKNKAWVKEFTLMKQQLISKQKGICPVCEENLFQMEWEELEIHHIIPQKERKINTLRNLLIMHQACHKNVTNCKDPILIAKYLSKGIIKI